MNDEHPPADDGHEESKGVRPYVITGGRTRATSVDLAFETLVETSVGVSTDRLHFERRAIAECCRQPLSIAEVAVHLQLPLGVARVLVSDLVDEGLLVTHATAGPSDRAFIERLREGIRSL